MTAVRLLALSRLNTPATANTPPMSAAIQAWSMPDSQGTMAMASPASSPKTPPSSLPLPGSCKTIRSSVACICMRQPPNQPDQIMIQIKREAVLTSNGCVFQPGFLFEPAFNLFGVVFQPVAGCVPRVEAVVVDGEH